jgi:Zn-dependent peptidase ImmA (M78 family)
LNNKKINLFGVPYIVHEVSGDNLYNNLLGQINYYTQEIKIRDGQAAEGKKVTLLHEICHLILSNFQIDRNKEESEVEAICDAVACGLFDIIQANQDVLKEIYFKGDKQ